MGILSPMFQIAGIVIASSFVEKLMEEHGQGGKTIFIKIATWATVAYIGLEAWWKIVHYVEMTFGV